MNRNLNTEGDINSDLEDNNSQISRIVISQKYFKPFNCKFFIGHDNSIKKIKGEQIDQFELIFSEKHSLNDVITSFNHVASDRNNNSYNSTFPINSLRCDFLASTGNLTIKFCVQNSDMNYGDLIEFLKLNDLVLIKNQQDEITLFQKENVDLDEVIDQIDQILFKNALNSVNHLLDEYKDLLLGIQGDQVNNDSVLFMDGTLSIEDLCELNENLAFLKKKLSNPLTKLSAEDIQLLCETCLLTDIIQEHNSSDFKLKLCSAIKVTCDKNGNCTSCNLLDE